MISGRVNNRYEAIVQILIQNQAGELVSVDAVVDTGFDGSLTLPANVIASLGLHWRGKAGVVLANGLVDECDVYAGVVKWDGIPRQVLVEAAETDPLVDMAMMKGFEMRLEVKLGGSVTLETMSA
jgi:clan AA aspartic protease